MADVMRAAVDMGCYDAHDWLLRNFNSTVVCEHCEDGFETAYRNEPRTCENCSYGDCDYGHAYQRRCSKCNGTSRVSVI